MQQRNSAGVELIGVSKVYNTRGESVTALDDVCLKIDDGSMLCVMGPSGSGKSTLLKVAAGYLPPDKGRVNLLGYPVYHLPIGERLMLRRSIGFMFQEDLLIDTLSLLENVELPLLIDGVGKRERREAAGRALECVDLKGKEERRPDEVSGGERRRASLARCLVNGPKILFVDEPTSNQDSKTALNMIELLKLLNRRGTTALISTHDRLVAEKVGTVLHLRDGSIVSKS